jgi:uncharacterized protein
MVSMMILFIIIGLGTYFGAHYLLFFSLVRFFQISSPQAKTTLFLIIAFLSLSFIFSLFLAHYKEGWFSRSFYIFSGFWLGLLVNFLLVVAVVWLVVGLTKIIGLESNAAIVAAFLFPIALGVSFYGAWNAFNPRVKNIEVEIKNLPAEWQGKNVVQLSDVHLGHIYQAPYLQKLVRQINTLQPEAVFITGDFFDGMDGELNLLVQPLNEIRAEKGIYFVTGNHETYLGVDKVVQALENTQVKILQNEVVDLSGLKIIGINYPLQGESNNEIKILESLKNKFAGSPNILLFHAPTNIEQVKNAGVDFQLAGHTHKGQLFPFGFITKLVYKGYDYGLHQNGDFSIYTTTGAGTWGPPMRTGNVPEIVEIRLKQAL